MLSPISPTRLTSTTGEQATRTPYSCEIGLLMLLAVLWGIPYALTKIALETIPPVTLVAARVSLAAAVLWAIVFVLRRKIPSRRGFVGPLFLQGCLGCLIPYSLTTWGQQTVDSALAAILNSTSPLFVCLITLIWTRHERVTFMRLLGISAGLGGVIMIAGVGALGGLGRQSAGQFAILLATLSLALSTLYGRRFVEEAPEVIVAGMLTWSAMMLVPLCFIVEEPFNSAPSTASIVALSVNGVLATALGFVLYFRLIRTIGSIGAASVGYLKPGVAVLIGCAMLGEPFTATLAFGLAAVLVGVTLIDRNGSKLISNALGIREYSPSLSKGYDEASTTPCASSSSDSFRRA